VKQLNNHYTYDKVVDQADPDDIFPTRRAAVIINQKRVSRHFYVVAASFCLILFPGHL
jgi:hypothetical protein